MTTIALLILSSLFAQDKDVLNFKKGTVWKFHGVEQGEKKTTVMTVVKKEKGKVYMESQEFSDGAEKPDKTETMVTWVKDGFIHWGEEKDGEVEERIKLYKIGSKKDDTWKSPLGEGVEVEIKNEGTTDLKIEAGMFKKAIHLRMTFGQGEMQGEGNFYIDANGALLKMEMKMGGELFVSMELFKVVEGK